MNKIWLIVRFGAISRLKIAIHNTSLLIFTMFGRHMINAVTLGLERYVICLFFLTM